MQEVETREILLDLVSKPEIAVDYGVVWKESVDGRGLDIALLYQTDTAEVTSSEQRQGCTDLVDGLGPDGNHDVNNPANELTCDSDGDGVNDGNRLFSRPPLLVEAIVCLNNCGTQYSEKMHVEPNSIKIWFIVVHWKSKFEDTDNYQHTLIRRLEQSQFVADLFHEITDKNPNGNVVILGDFNDYADSFPVKLLETNGLVNLVKQIERNERYTYIYQGVSQVLDHVMVRFDSRLKADVVSTVHVNADYPYAYKSITESTHRSSDHDPVILSLNWYGLERYLPLVTQP